MEQEVLKNAFFHHTSRATTSRPDLLTRYPRRSEIFDFLLRRITVDRRIISCHSWPLAADYDSA